MELRKVIGQIQGGDRQAFTELTDAYKDLAFGYAYAILRDFHLAEDATQEALVTAFFELSKLQEAEAFPGWLRGIVRFQCYRILRKRYLKLLPLEDAAEAPTIEPGPDEQIEQRDMRRRVLAAVDTLSQAHREVIMLFYMREYSQQEVATFLELPVSTVNNRLHAARKQLKRRILPMVKDAFQEHALPDDFTSRIGKIVEVRGPIIDAHFAPDRLPALLTALTLSDEAQTVAVTVQVAQHLGGGDVRCVVVEGADALLPGMRLVDTGLLVQQPVLPEAVENASTLFGVRSGVASDAILETGIKSLDLFCPYGRGGKVAILGDHGTGKLVVSEEIVHNIVQDRGGISLFTFVRPGTPITWEHAQAIELAMTQSVETIVLAADDPTGATTMAEQFDAATYMTAELARQGLYPAIDPLRSHSRLLSPTIVGQEHYDVAQGAREILQHAQMLATKSERMTVEETLILGRAARLRRFLTQPFFVAEPYTNRSGIYVPCKETVRGCKEILAGLHDDLPEAAFLWSGTIDHVIEKAAQLE